MRALPSSYGWWAEGQRLSLCNLSSRTKNFIPHGKSEPYKVSTFRQSARQYHDTMLCVHSSSNRAFKLKTSAFKYKPRMVLGWKLPCYHFNMKQKHSCTCIVHNLHTHHYPAIDTSVPSLRFSHTTQSPSSSIFAIHNNHRIKYTRENQHICQTSEHQFMSYIPAQLCIRNERPVLNIPPLPRAPEINHLQQRRVQQQQQKKKKTLRKCKECN